MAAGCRGAALSGAACAALAAATAARLAKIVVREILLSFSNML
jgi:hypothetical protein